MASPSDRFYTSTHEWIKPDGDGVLIGISKFAVDELTDVTFVEMPVVGKAVTAGKAFGEVESVKATSEIYSPLDGEVTAVNQAVKDDPSLLNQDPYELGWLIRLKTAQKDFSAFLTAEKYDAAHSGH